jgi:hypothetical protein
MYDSHEMHTLLSFIRDNDLLHIVAGAFALLLAAIAVFYRRLFKPNRLFSTSAPKFGHQVDTTSAGGTTTRKRASKPLAAPLMLKCYNCGSPVAVTNPRVEKEPKYAFLHPHLGEVNENALAVTVSCAVCKQPQIAQFRY